MERRDTRGGRAQAAKHSARPRAGLREAVADMIAETASAGPRDWAALAAVVLCIVFVGLMEGSTWPM